MGRKEKRKIVLFFMIWTIFLVGICMIVSWQAKENYQNYMLQLTSQVVDNIHIKYPEAEEQIIKNIIQESESESEINTLEKYGIDRRIIASQKQGKEINQKLMIEIVVIIGVGIASMVYFFYLYHKKQIKKWEELDAYCQEMIKGNQTVKIREQREGIESIVTNDIYDMTMLLQQKNEQLDKTNQDIEKLIADISHQIKTPLTSLNMMNDLLYTEMPEEKRKEFLDHMQQELEKIYWLIKTLLNIAKLDSKTLILEKKRNNAYNLLQEIKNDFNAMCEVKQAKIIIETKQKDEIYCDKKWTKEAIGNIIKNALEHGATKVKLNAEENYLYTQIKIEDNGEGISTKDKAHIFERFYKSQNSREDSLGLGLAFCKSIIKNQEGEIKVKSKIGEGSTFILKIRK